MYIEEVRMEKYIKLFKAAIDRKLLCKADITNTYMDYKCDALVLEIGVYLARREYTETEYVSVPNTWVDAFKLAYFPQWMLRWWPANMKEIKKQIQYINMCPHIYFDKDTHVAFLARSY